MQWVKSLNIFKPTAKVTPAKSSPTKPAFSRNTAKQKGMFFHCFPTVLRKAFPYSWRWLPQNLSHSEWGFFWQIFGKHNHPEIITNGDGQTGFLRYFLCFFSQSKLLTPWGIPHSQPLPVFRYSGAKRMWSRNKLCLHMTWRHHVGIDFTSASTWALGNSCINSDGISWPWTYLQLHVTRFSGTFTFPGQEESWQF